MPVRSIVSLIGQRITARETRGRTGRFLATAVAIAALAWLSVHSRSVADAAATLVVIGFDAERARLIAALVFETILVALATMAFAMPRSAAFGGVAAFGGYFWKTFERETSNALHASGPQGTFDPWGWALTVLTLLVVALAIGWSAATLALVARRHAIVAGRDLIAFARIDRARRRLRAPVVALLVIAALAVTLPAFGDMVNFEPDAHMRRGANAGPGLAAEGPAVRIPAAAASLPPSLLAGGGVFGPGVGSGLSSGVLSSARPWLAWLPSGAGSTATIGVDAPWTASPAARTEVSVYLPPGYRSGSVRYPVIYNVPFGLNSWTSYIQMPNLLDNLIDSGAIPPVIVAFVSEHGGPYPDSECANSADGREWFEKYIVNTVVPLIDSTYRTITQAAARAVMGYSQGGYCAPMLTLRHPDVFGSSISFSGYFQAGIRSGQTPNAWLPYGGNRTLEAQASPLDIAARVAPALRRRLFFELSAGPTQRFYGPQYVAFAKILAGSDVPFALFPTPLGHAWSAVHDQLPGMLEMLAARETALGVFSA